MAQRVKHLPTVFKPWVGKIPRRRKWQPTPVLLPGKSRGLRSLVGYSPWGGKQSDTTERLHFFYSLEHPLDLDVYPTHVCFTELISLGSEIIQPNKSNARIPGFWGQCHTDVTGTWLEVLIAKLVKPNMHISLASFYKLRCSLGFLNKLRPQSVHFSHSVMSYSF